MLYAEQAYQWHEELLRIASTYASALAEDVVAEVYAKLHMYSLTGKKIKDLKPYTVRMVRNTAVTMARREKKYTEEANAEAHVENEQPSPLEGLPEEAQLLLRMRYEWGYTLNELAFILDVSPTTVSRRLADAQTLLTDQ